MFIIKNIIDFFKYIKFLKLIIYSIKIRKYLIKK
jgi:hypothetical protein